MCGEEGGGRTRLRGKAQQLRGSDAGQKKSESSTSHKTLSSGIVYRQTGITAPPPPPSPRTHSPPGTHNTLPHMQTKGAPPSLAYHHPVAPTQAPASIGSPVI